MRLLALFVPFLMTQVLKILVKFMALSKLLIIGANAVLANLSLQLRVVIWYQFLINLFFQLFLILVNKVRFELFYGRDGRLRLLEGLWLL